VSASGTLAGAYLREAVAAARARAWKLGARPEPTVQDSGAERTVLDLDATLTHAYSEKEQAHGNFRPGNAGSNTASAHTQGCETFLRLHTGDPGTHREIGCWLIMATGYWEDVVVSPEFEAALGRADRRSDRSARRRRLLLRRASFGWGERRTAAVGLPKSE
jgi:hypothetical protein